MQGSESERYRNIIKDYLMKFIKEFSIEDISNMLRAITGAPYLGAREKLTFNVIPSSQRLSQDDRYGSTCFVHTCFSKVDIHPDSLKSYAAFRETLVGIRVMRKDGVVYTSR